MGDEVGRMFWSRGTETAIRIYRMKKNLFLIKGSKNNEHTTECAWYISIAVIRH